MHFSKVTLTIYQRRSRSPTESFEGSPHPQLAACPPPGGQVLALCFLVQLPQCPGARRSVVSLCLWGCGPGGGPMCHPSPLSRQGPGPVSQESRQETRVSAGEPLLPAPRQQWRGGRPQVAANTETLGPKQRLRRVECGDTLQERWTRVSQAWGPGVNRAGQTDRGQRWVLGGAAAAVRWAAGGVPAEVPPGWTCAWSSSPPASQGSPSAFSPLCPGGDSPGSSLPQEMPRPLSAPPPGEAFPDLQ